MDELASPFYRDVLRTMHSAGPWGNKGFKYYGDVWAIRERLGCRSILDYGSGMETLRHHIERLHPGETVACYDPGIPGRDHLPAPADLVACTDVLEHVEPLLLNGVLGHMFDVLAQRALFLHIAVQPAKQILPDGRNAHLIVHAPQWWREKISKRLGTKWRLTDYRPARKHVKFTIEREMT